MGRSISYTPPQHIWPYVCLPHTIPCMNPLYGTIHFIHPTSTHLALCVHTPHHPRQRYEANKQSVPTPHHPQQRYEANKPDRYDETKGKKVWDSILPNRDMKRISQIGTTKRKVKKYGIPRLPFLLWNPLYESSVWDDPLHTPHLNTFGPMCAYPTPPPTEI